MKKINLINNKEVIFVDNEDYNWLSKYKWYLIKNKERKYGYVYTPIYIDRKRQTIRMHKLIMNTPKGYEIDHIDGNGFNNQKNNLRIVSNKQNQMNRKKQKDTSSKFKGVSWNKRDKKWITHITVNRKSYYLGVFINEIDAAKAYNEAAIEMFGEYANLNKV